MTTHMIPRTGGPVPFEPAEAEIQKRAYFLWQEEGCPVGRDLEIWLAAKELVRHFPAHPAPDSAGRHNVRPGPRRKQVA